MYCVPKRILCAYYTGTAKCVMIISLYGMIACMLYTNLFRVLVATSDNLFIE